MRLGVTMKRQAGGACYGYTLERHSEVDGKGRRRGYTTATVNKEEAKVIRRIFAEYIAGKGLGAIAKMLHAQQPPSPPPRNTGDHVPEKRSRRRAGLGQGDA